MDRFEDRLTRTAETKAARAAVDAAMAFLAETFNVDVSRNCGCGEAESIYVGNMMEIMGRYSEGRYGQHHVGGTITVTSEIYRINARTFRLRKDGTFNTTAIVKAIRSNYSKEAQA